MKNDLVTDVQDFESEEDSSEKSADENEKKEFKEDFFFHENNGLLAYTQLAFSQTGSFIFSTADYSQTVYSPPEYTCA